MNTELATHVCDICGKEFVIDDIGIARHVFADGVTDYDADEDHVPYTSDDA